MSSLETSGSEFVSDEQLRGWLQLFLDDRAVGGVTGQDAQARLAPDQPVFIDQVSCRGGEFDPLKTRFRLVLPKARRGRLRGIDPK